MVGRDRLEKPRDHGLEKTGDAGDDPRIFKYFSNTKPQRDDPEQKQRYLDSRFGAVEHGTGEGVEPACAGCNDDAD